MPAARLRGEDPDDIVAAVALCDVRGSFTPDLAVLEPAVDALDLWSAGGV